jgi:superfamily II DNA or RNA helicase
MPKGNNKNGNGQRAQGATKYDAHHTVLNRTYGALADLRRELSDSKAEVAERTELLNQFSNCADSQRAWLLLEDYFEKLSLSRRDFPGEEWWPKLMTISGKDRLEGLAFLFLRTHRPLPTEMVAFANLEHFAEVEEAREESNFMQDLEKWLFPPAPAHLDTPRASLRILCKSQTDPDHEPLCRLGIQFQLFRPRTGEKFKSLAEVVELTSRATHEHELFQPNDWQFIQWLGETHPHEPDAAESFYLQDLNLLQWLAKWGGTDRLEFAGQSKSVRFHGQMMEMVPHLEAAGDETFFSHRILMPDGSHKPVTEAVFFSLNPPLALVGDTFYLVRNAPPLSLIRHWAQHPATPVSKLSHGLIKKLRRTKTVSSMDWNVLCISHTATPQFVFELLDEVVQLRLLARSERDQGIWIWNGHEWQLNKPPVPGVGNSTSKPEMLDDPRLEPAVQWLQQLDWFTPEPGLWVGDANDNFLDALGAAWADRPYSAEFLGNPAFHRLFLNPRQLRPRLVVRGSGIDWLSVSAEWEEEGLKLTAADLVRLQTATGRFVKLPDSGWVELDAGAVQNAHETMADLGVEGLVAVPKRIGIEHAAHMGEEDLKKLGDSEHAQSLRERLKDFKCVPSAGLPATVLAELRPYQKEGFDFLCHLSQIKLGGILADDMGLGKTLQTLSWLAWLFEQHRHEHKPALVICPASVLHNWRREANRFTPHLRVLVLESGAARHNLRKQIPEHDLIVTNYALLRRDLEALQKFDFRSVVLDEAQFIKNPAAQVTHSVKQLKADHMLALTGTPLENRLLDLWSIVDFIQPGYLGNQEHFTQLYEPKGDDNHNAQRIARRRLSSKLRPLMLRRLKQRVAKDLPERIEERRDCNLGDEQRKLYLAELRRSREQVFQTVSERGLNQSKIHVLAALTRLRQICCHPQLVGNDAPSGKTETLFELLDPLLADGQKVLVFSQFVQVLKLLEVECVKRQIKTHLLTGQTKQRQEIVTAFQNDPDPAVFLLSLRAAGTGLNLTNASYVVLYDPWWNPAVEAQAIDRSHRIGQLNTVNAYRLIAPGTVEEKIWELQQSKAQTIADVLGEEGFARSLSKTDLEYLFSEE